MKTLLAFTLATVYGLFVRFFFLFYNNITEVISISMVAAAPLAVGFLTVAASGLKRVSNGWAAFFRPWLSSLLLLILTILLAWEGAICWIMIFPFFAVAAGIGGLIAYAWMRARERRQQQGERQDVLDDFDRNGGLQTSLILIMPCLLGLIEQDRLLTPAAYTVHASRVIHAPTEAVWAALTAPAVEHAPQENRSFFTHFWGLPRHLRTELDTPAVGGRRVAMYERGLYFEETILTYEPPYRLRVAIKADPGNVPPQVLDEHIVVGGRHFKALEDTYTLTPLPNGACRVELSGNISIQTPFNWYAGIWARWVLRDLFQDQLRQLQHRSALQ